MFYWTILLSAVLRFTAVTPAKIPRIDIDCKSRASIMEPEEFMATCPPNCHLLPYRIWGIDAYKMDSSICVAAIHAGRINASTGGEIYVKKTIEYRHYNASKRHGIQSLSYPSNLWRRGIVFKDWKYMTPKKSIEFSCNVRGGDTSTLSITMNTRGMKMYTHCPAECVRIAANKRKELPLWGDRVYAAQSSVCYAAIHNGLLDDLQGKWIIVERGPLLLYFRGTVGRHNNISSKSLMRFSHSFSVKPYHR